MRQDRVGIRTSWFEHDGRRLVYDVYGDEGPLLVYLHGLLVDSDMNRGIAEAIARRGHRVVLLDLLGHGRSDKPVHASEYRIDTYAEQVFGLLDHLGEDATALGGMSLGANVSLFAATRHPERVRGLVLEMPVLEWAVPSGAIIFTTMLLAARYGGPLLRVIGGLVERVPPTPFPPLDSVLHVGTVPPEAIAAVLHGVLVGPIAPTIDERTAIEVPTLVLAHRNDVIHPFDDAHNLVEQLPNATLERARSPLELRLRPDRLTDVIGAFIDELPAAVPRTSRAG
jgi:pimeloyl-ACP methyl ester carboxylesterase